jgi:hypothetical protein
MQHAEKKQHFTSTTTWISKRPFLKEESWGTPESTLTASDETPSSTTVYPLQHGFRKGRSCETQLIEYVDNVSKNLQEGCQTDILIMDFAKAFDKVNHSLVIFICDSEVYDGIISKESDFGG